MTWEPRLIVPMSGLGSRFLRAGYSMPKPLLPVHNRPIIEWVLAAFPGAIDPLFICRKEHLEETNMRDILLALKPEATILGIEGAKLGPVDALLKAQDAIDDRRAAIVSYCDYYMQWDYRLFVEHVMRTQCAGSVPCYTGFHPHLLPRKNLYACCRVDDDDRLLEIREKHSFTDDKTLSRHSPGAYYFAEGQLLKHYSRRLMEAEDSLNGEYYVSMVYNHMIADKLLVTAPANVKHFCQWGTPEDLEDYLFWVDAIRGWRA